MSIEWGYVPQQPFATPIGMALMTGSSDGKTSDSKTKKFKSYQTKINEESLRSELESLAKQRHGHVFRWDAKHYQKPLRSTGPDRAMLKDSVPVA